MNRLFDGTLLVGTFLLVAGCSQRSSGEVDVGTGGGADAATGTDTVSGGQDSGASSESDDTAGDTSDSSSDSSGESGETDSGGAPPMQCAPLDEVACMCSDGEVLTRVCYADGSRFGDCLCGYQFDPADCVERPSDPFCGGALPVELSDEDLQVGIEPLQGVLASCVSRYASESGLEQVVVTAGMLRFGFYSAATVETLDIPDGGLYSCIEEVVGLALFRPFQGPAYSTSFTIRFQ